MQSFWRLLNKPRIDDWSPLAKFYYADDALNAIANELDSFDGRRDPERCNQLVNKLRQAQDRVLHIICSNCLNNYAPYIQINYKSLSRDAVHLLPT
jgi:hypothetical protein